MDEEGEGVCYNNRLPWMDGLGDLDDDGVFVSFGFIFLHILGFASKITIGKLLYLCIILGLYSCVCVCVCVCLSRCGCVIIFACVMNDCVCMCVV